MQINVQKFREMQRNSEKSREMQISRDILMTLMTHGNVIFDILEPLAFRNISHVGSYRNLKNLKKFVHACMVNVIHAKALPGFVLYVEHSIGDCEKQVATQMPCRETIRKALRVIIQILRALIYIQA